MMGYGAYNRETIEQSKRAAQRLRLHADTQKRLAYWAIAAAQAKRGDMAEANKSLRMVSAAESPDGLADACVAIVQERLNSVKDGGLTEAIEFIARVTNEFGVDWGKARWEIE